MKTVHKKLKKAYILFSEYVRYIVTKPRLIFSIPKRLGEEFLLHVRYIGAKITKTSNNIHLIQQLGALRTDMEKANPVYTPSVLWDDLYDQFERVLHVEDIKNFKTQRYNRRFSAFAPTDPIFYKMFLWLYWQNIKKRDSLNLLNKLKEPQLGNPDTYIIKGTIMSHDLLQSLDEFYAIYPSLKQINKHLIVTELGSGYGRLGYVFLSAILKSTYIIVDLPGSLIIA